MTMMIRIPIETFAQGAKVESLLLAKKIPFERDMVRDEPVTPATNGNGHATNGNGKTVRRHFSEHEIEQIFAMDAKGFNSREIAERTGRERASVRYILDLDSTKAKEIATRTNWKRRGKA